jgi:hypothetical protein
MSASGRAGPTDGWQQQLALAQSWFETRHDGLSEPASPPRRQPHDQDVRDPDVPAVTWPARLRPLAVVAAPEHTPVSPPPPAAKRHGPVQSHVHVESAPDGLRVWLGLPGPTVYVQLLLADTLPRLRRSLHEAGQPLAQVVCNGRPVAAPHVFYRES